MNKNMLKIAILEEIERMIGEDALVNPEKDSHVRADFDVYRSVNEKSTCSECGGAMYEGMCEQCGTMESKILEGPMCEQCGSSLMHEGECMTCGYMGKMLNEGDCGCDAGCGCRKTESDYSLAFLNHNLGNHVSHDKKISKHVHNNYMAKPSLYKVAKYAKKLLHMIPDGYELDDWQRTKIAQIADDISEVYHSLDYDFHDDEN